MYNGGGERIYGGERWWRCIMVGRDIFIAKSGKATLSSVWLEGASHEKIPWQMNSGVKILKFYHSWEIKQLSEKLILFWCWERLFGLCLTSLFILFLFWKRKLVSILETRLYASTSSFHLYQEDEYDYSSCCQRAFKKMTLSPHWLCEFLVRGPHDQNID